MNKRGIDKLLILLITFYSCRSLPDLNNTSYYRAKKNFEFSGKELVSVGIDTSNIYKAHSFWIGPYDFDSKERKNYSLIRDVRDVYGSALPKNKFLKFQSKGKMNFYYLEKETPLTQNYFTKENGFIGVYDIHNGMIYTKRYLGIGHGPMLVRGKIKIKGDTLHHIEKGGGYNSHAYYIKIK